MFQRQSPFGAAAVTLRGSTPASASAPAYRNPFLRMGQASTSPEQGWDKPDKTAKLVGRLCGVLRGFADRSVDEQVAGEIFWSYVDYDKVPDEVVRRLVSGNCPGLVIPVRPIVVGDKMTEPRQQGFHGKAQVGVDEARELAQLLSVVVAPLTPEEAASEIADQACLRELTRAGGFPIVERLLERLEAFLATAKNGDTFEISQGELTVTGKAVECAEALKRVKLTRTVVTAGGIVVGAGILALLLGVL